MENILEMSQYDSDKIQFRFIEDEFTGCMFDAPKIKSWLQYLKDHPSLARPFFATPESIEQMKVDFKRLWGRPEPIVMYQSAGQQYPIGANAIWCWDKIVAIVKIYLKDQQ